MGLWPDSCSGGEKEDSRAGLLAVHGSYVVHTLPVSISEDIFNLYHGLNLISDLPCCIHSNTPCQCTDFRTMVYGRPFVLKDRP